MFTQAQVNAIAAAFQSALAQALQSLVDTAPAAVTIPAVSVQAPAPAPIPAPVPAPVQTLDAVTFTIDANGYRVDDIVPAGTPGTVTVPSGHVLSRPKPNPLAPKDGEMFAGYVARVMRQCKGEQLQADQVFVSLMAGGSERLFAKFGPFDTVGTYWPQAADYYYNPELYMTDAEKAAEAARAAAWEDYNNKLKESLQAQQSAIKAQQRAQQAGAPIGGRGAHQRALAAANAKAANDVPLAAVPQPEAAPPSQAPTAG